MEGQAWMVMRRVCGSLMALNCSRMLFAGRTVQRGLLARGYATCGGRICIKRWTCCALLSTSIRTSAWSVQSSSWLGHCFVVGDVFLKCVVDALRQQLSTVFAMSLVSFSFCASPINVDTNTCNRTQSSPVS